jgi:Transcriptional regulator
MQDRRKKKTEQAIRTAFAKLLSEKDIDKITVKNLCELADINKSTFYLHYKDIYDCADCLQNEIVIELGKAISSYDFMGIITHFTTILEDMMKIFEKNKELYMPFLKSPSLSSSLCKMKHTIIDRVFEKTDDKDGLSQCAVSFVIGGMISILEQYDFSEIGHKSVLALADQVQNGFIH